MNIHVTCNGDDSAGIPGCSATINIAGLKELLEDDRAAREWLRGKLRRTFSELWDDGSTLVGFEDEHQPPLRS